MRRTLFVVPRELVPVVYAACTRTIAARERRRLEKMIVDSGISTRPAAWLTRASTGRAARARGARRSVHRGSHEGRPDPRQAPSVRRRDRRFEATQSVGSRVLPQLAMEGRIVRGRPRGTWVNGQYRWVPMESWLGGGVRRSFGPRMRQAELLRHWLAAFGPATETDMRWWTGWTAREARAALAAVPHDVVDLDGATGFVLADDLEPDRASGALGRAASRRSTRRRWAGRSATGTSARTLRCSSTRTATPARPCGGTAGSSAAGRSGEDGEIVFRLLEDVGAEAVSVGRGRGGAGRRVARRQALLAGVPAAVPARAGGR